MLLKNLAEAFGAASNGRSVRLPGALDLPLPPLPRGLDVSFWLEACWQLLGSPPDHAVVFWSAPEAADARVLVAPVPSPAGVFARLLAAPAASGGGVHVLDDAAGQPAALAALALPARLGTLLENDALSLHAFIHGLRP